MKTTHKLIALVLTMVMVLSLFVFPVQAATADAVFEFGEYVVEGNTATIPVKLAKVPGSLANISAITVNYEIPSGLTFISADAVAAGVAGADSTSVGFSWFAQGGGISLADGDVLFNIVVKNVDSAQDEFTIRLTDAYLMDGSYNEPESYLLDEITVVVSPSGKAVFEFGDYVVSGNTATIPVKLAAVPENLIDISAITVNYEIPSGLTFISADAVAAGVTGAVTTETGFSWFANGAGVSLAAGDAIFNIVVSKASDELNTFTVKLTDAYLMDSAYAEPTSYGLDEIEIAIDYTENGIFKFGEHDYDGEYVTIPVKLSAIPEGLSDISALTVYYSLPKELEFVQAIPVIEGFDGFTASATQFSWFNPSYTEPGPDALALKNADNVLFELVARKTAGATGVVTVIITDARMLDIDGYQPTGYVLDNCKIDLTLLSSDTTLSNLTINGKTVSGFDPAVNEYNYIAEYAATSVTVAATTTHPNAKAVVSGGKDLVVGRNTVTVTVTAEDGTTATYTINVVREDLEVSTVTIAAGEVDATDIKTGNEIVIPITIDKWLAEKIYAAQIDVKFDKRVLEYVSFESVMLPTIGGTTVVPQVTASWVTTPVETANENGKLVAAFLDTSFGEQGFGTPSIEDANYGTNVLFNIKFRVVTSKVVNTEVKVGNALLSDYSKGREVQHDVASGHIITEDCTIKFGYTADDFEIEKWILGNGNYEDFIVFDTNDTTASMMTYQVLKDKVIVEGFEDVLLDIPNNSTEISVSAETINLEIEGIEYGVLYAHGKHDVLNMSTKNVHKFQSLDSKGGAFGVRVVDTSGKTNYGTMCTYVKYGNNYRFGTPVTKKLIKCAFFETASRGNTYFVFQ